MMLPNIGQHLTAHMAKAPPIELDYTIQTEGPSPTHPDCYDIEVDVPASHSPVLTDFLQKLNKDREMEVYDGRISAGIEKINEHRRRRAFLLGLSQSPVDFLNSLVASQAKDLRAAQSTPGQGAAYEGLRRTELFQGTFLFALPGLSSCVLPPPLPSVLQPLSALHRETSTRGSFNRRYSHALYGCVLRLRGLF